MTEQYPPQGQPWQPQQYDPQLHRQRIGGQPPQQPYPQEPFYGEYQPQPNRRKRSRAPLYAVVALVAIAGGTAYALTGGGSPAKPLTCKQQYQQWKTGPAGAIAKRTLTADDSALTSAANSDDIPAMNSALGKLGNDATQLGQYPMPPCADPAGYWPQMLAGLKAAGDNAGSTSGLGGLLTAMAPMEKVKALEVKLSAELARTADVKNAG